MSCIEIEEEFEVEKLETTKEDTMTGRGVRKKIDDADGMTICSIDSKGTTYEFELETADDQNAYVFAYKNPSEEGDDQSRSGAGHDLIGQNTYVFVSNQSRSGVG